MENQIVNWGGALFSASTPKLLQGFMTLFCVLLAVRLLRNAYVAFRESRSETPVFSRNEMAQFISAEMRQIQNILEDAGIDWNDDIAFQWMLFLARKIRVRARIVLVNGQRYEAAGFSNIHEFFAKADLRLGESVDVASRAKDGTPNWQRTETMKIAGEVISIAKEVARNVGSRSMSTPTEYHRFCRNKG